MAIWDRWQHGWKVSKVVGGPGGSLVTGSVLVLQRQSDGGRYIKVLVDGIPDERARQRVWPDGWLLGVGRKQARCLQCGDPYRYEDATEGFCPGCDATFAQEVAAASNTRSVGGSLRGASTPMKRVQNTATPEEIAEIKRRDAEESIFG